MSSAMEEIKELIDKYSKPLSREDITKIIYKLYCVVILLLPVIPEIIGVGVYSVKATVFNFFTILTFLLLMIINIKSLKPNMYDGILLVYLILVILSTIFTKFGVLNCVLGTNGRGEGLITIFSYAMTFYIFTKGYKYMGNVLKSALVGAIIVSIYSIIQANVPLDIELPYWHKRMEGVANGTMGNQNFLSSYICIFLPAMFFNYISTGKKRNIPVILLLFTALVYSITLGGYITFVAMSLFSVVISMIYSKNKKKTLLNILIIAILISLVYAVITYDGGEKYTNEIAQTKEEVTKLVEKDDDFGSGRMACWRKTLHVIKNNTLFGTGPDSLADELDNDIYITNGDKDILNYVIIDKAHSEPLHIAATTGVISAIVYLVFVIAVVLRLIINCLRKVKENGFEKPNTIATIIILISVLSYLMQSMINVSVVQVAPVFWAILGIAAGITLEKKISTR